MAVRATVTQLLFRNVLETFLKWSQNVLKKRFWYTKRARHILNVFILHFWNVSVKFQKRIWKTFKNWFKETFQEHSLKMLRNHFRKCSGNVFQIRFRNILWKCFGTISRNCSENVFRNVSELIAENVQTKNISGKCFKTVFKKIFWTVSKARSLETFLRRHLYINICSIYIGQVKSNVITYFCLLDTVQQWNSHHGFIILYEYLNYLMPFLELNHMSENENKGSSSSKISK